VRDHPLLLFWEELNVSAHDVGDDDGNRRTGDVSGGVARSVLERTSLPRGGLTLVSAIVRDDDGDRRTGDVSGGVARSVLDAVGPSAPRALAASA
jgi:hypothetical protein